MPRNRKIALMMMCAALPVMMAAILSPALPALQANFAEDPDIQLLAKLVLTTPALAIAVSAGFIGFLVDRWGSYRFMVLSLLIFLIFGVQGLWLEDIRFLIASRFCFGLGVAGLMTASAAWFASNFEGRKLRSIVALQAACMGAFGFASQLIAGYLASHSWRLPFALYALALPVLLLLLCNRELAQPSPQEAASPQNKVAKFRGFRFQVAVLALVSGATMSLFSLVPVQGPLFFHHVLNLSPQSTAFFISSLTAASSLASLLLAFWRPSLSPLWALALGLCTIAGGFCCLMFAGNSALLLTSMIGIGAGVGIVIPCIHAMIGSTVPPSFRGRVLGMILTVNYIGQFLSPFWAQAILSRSTERQLFGLSSLIALGLTLVLMLLREKPSRVPQQT